VRSCADAGFLQESVEAVLGAEQQLLALPIDAQRVCLRVESHTADGVDGTFGPLVRSSVEQFDGFREVLERSHANRRERDVGVIVCCVADGAGDEELGSARLCRDGHLVAREDQLTADTLVVLRCGSPCGTATRS
jgi:hypothetical protein